MDSEIIKAYLYNNPPLEGAIFETIGGGYKWQMKNVPHIDVIGTGIENIKSILEIRVLSKEGKEIYAAEKEIEVKDNKFSIKFELVSPLKNPDKIKIKLKNSLSHLPKLVCHNFYIFMTNGSSRFLILAM